MLLTPDTGLDAEIWEWCPEGVIPYLTRLQIPDTAADHLPSIDSVIGSAEVVQSATRSLVGTKSLPGVDPDIVLLNCTSASFVGGLAGERLIRRSILSAGAPRALTTSGAVVGALTVLNASRVAVGTPYDEETNVWLKQFLAEAGFELNSIAATPVENLDHTSDDQIRAVAAAAYDKKASAMFISCAALRTRHLVSELSAQYGMPVITSLQATMWAALAHIGERVIASDHVLNSLPWPKRTSLLAP
ncbi:maleate cis-trans isomerase family protein [Rhizobium laguerreae]|uniref:maleate cis-trans isomerase family protein n=1 Tax=Rhizobium laguerreae TaxID=1076926 RepID=UPI0036F35D59